MLAATRGSAAAGRGPGEPGRPGRLPRRVEPPVEPRPDSAPRGAADPVAVPGDAGGVRAAGRRCGAASARHDRGRPLGPRRPGDRGRHGPSPGGRRQRARLPRGRHLRRRHRRPVPQRGVPARDREPGADRPGRDLRHPGRVADGPQCHQRRGRPHRRGRADRDVRDDRRGRHRAARPGPSVGRRAGLAARLSCRASRGQTTRHARGLGRVASFVPRSGRKGGRVSSGSGPP